VNKSKILPCPPVILAMISLPQRINQTTPPIRSKTIKRIIPMIILRFLLMGFLCIFLAFFDWLVNSEGSDAFNSPVCSSKSKA